MRIVSRVLYTVLIFAWWCLGLIFWVSVDSLVLGVPLLAVGLVMSWKIADPDRF